MGDCALSCGKRALIDVSALPHDSDSILQVQGQGAFELLKKRVATGGIGQLYSGSVANFTANWCAQQ